MAGLSFRNSLRNFSPEILAVGLVTFTLAVLLHQYISGSWFWNVISPNTDFEAILTGWLGLAGFVLIIAAVVLELTGSPLDHFIGPEDTES